MHTNLATHIQVYNCGWSTLFMTFDATLHNLVTTQSSKQNSDLFCLCQTKIVCVCVASVFPMRYSLSMSRDLWQLHAGCITYSMEKSASITCHNSAFKFSNTSNNAHKYVHICVRHMQQSSQHRYLFCSVITPLRLLPIYASETYIQMRIGIYIHPCNI